MVGRFARSLKMTTPTRHHDPARQRTGIGLATLAAVMLVMATASAMQRIGVPGPTSHGVEAAR